MKKLPCFIYRAGEHFTLPPKFDEASPKLCEFAIPDSAGRPTPHPQVFYPVDKPEDAAWFLFPYDIGHYVDALFLPQLEALLYALPYYRGRERRHIVCDGGDLPDTLSIPACLFKVSLTRQNAGRAIGTWYELPEHTAAARASFDWGTLSYDCAFVGNMTNPLRKAALLSLQHQGGGLRLKIDLDDSLYFKGDYYYSYEQSPEQKAARQKIYLEATRQSLTVLCPPGIGPHSIRLYETMHLGRIPVTFGEDAVYPFSAEIDYNSFCLNIPMAELMNTGSLLQTWLSECAPGQLHEMCVTACRAWNKYLAPDTKLPRLLSAADKMWS